MGTFSPVKRDYLFICSFATENFPLEGNTKSRVPSTFQPDFAARSVNHSLQSLKGTYEIPADALFFINSK